MILSYVIEKIKYRFKNLQPPIYLDDVIADFSGKFDISPLSVTITDRKKIDIRTRVGWPWSSQAIIEVTQGAINKLSEQELIAGVTHEIGHITQDITSLRWARFLSRIGMFPNSFLSLYFDFVEREFKADEFTLDAGVSKIALRDAILRERGQKDSNYESIFSSSESSRFLQKIDVVSTFFMGDENLLYGHPYLKERLAKIQNYES